MAFAGVTHKLACQQREIERFINRHRINFAFNLHSPVIPLEVMHGAVFATGKAWERAYTDAVFQARALRLKSDS